jgi:putative DNA primase/helicase
LKELLLHKWLMSAVAAACHDPLIEPFMARGVLVLAGAQYIGKTRWVCALAPREWIKEGLTLDPSNKDSVLYAISHWICELGELDSTLRRDIARLKAFLTMGADKLRMPFAPKISDFPRRTVFSASVNEPEFLIDPTGNSRFWVIPVETIQYDHKIDMQQVYAQLYAEWQSGGQWWLSREENERLEKCNEDHEQRDEVYDLITSRIDWSQLNLTYCDWMTPTEVLMERCKIERPTKSQRNSCARYLRKLTGIEKGKQVRGSAQKWPIPK